MNHHTRLASRLASASSLLGLALLAGPGCRAPAAGSSPHDTDGGSGTATAGPPSPFADEAAFQLAGFEARYHDGLDALVLELTVEGDAGSVAPTPVGAVDGAPVLGYVVPTTLDPSDIGFDGMDGMDGTVALAVTSHPDFDDTPLWDEDGNANYDDDGVVYHAHWVVLTSDDEAPAGLAVPSVPDSVGLPPTAPMPMALDSPGFTVVEDGRSIRVVVPLDRVRRRVDFEVGALTAAMRVDASGDAPTLRVDAVLSALEQGAATTAIQEADRAPASAWPGASAELEGFQLSDAAAQYDPTIDTFVFSMTVSGVAASHVPTPAGQVDGAPVLGYVFPTDIPPQTVGFAGAEGTLALAVTSHPDFDDTPLWDENLDRDFGNDGGTYHVHWVVLAEDEQSGAGLSVPSADPAALPRTAPMPMYLDSPGYHAFAVGDAVHVLVPGWHLAGVDRLAFDAVTARMQVDASAERPVLRVEEVFDILSGDLSLPRSVSRP
ncbi:MAG: hypothetical protein AAF721_37285 [Myxococcota bacterium]